MPAHAVTNSRCPSSLNAMYTCLPGSAVGCMQVAPTSCVHTNENTLGLTVKAVILIVGLEPLTKNTESQVNHKVGSIWQDKLQTQDRPTKQQAQAIPGHSLECLLQVCHSSPAWMLQFPANRQTLPGLLCKQLPANELPWYKTVKLHTNTVLTTTCGTNCTRGGTSAHMHILQHMLQEVCLDYQGPGEGPLQASQGTAAPNSLEGKAQEESWGLQHGCKCPFPTVKLHSAAMDTRQPAEN